MTDEKSKKDPKEKASSSKEPAKAKKTSTVKKNKAKSDLKVGKKVPPKKAVLSSKEIDKLIIENADLQAKTKEVQDNFLLLAAEFENYKKRINKDQVRTKELYKDSMLANLLPVIDNIDRALQHHDKDSKIFKGFTMIRSELLSYLENYKVSPFNAVGEEFDPEKHNAMLTRAVEDEKDNIILEEFEKGYMIDNKVLRYAKVIVNIIE
jgi:molecular chaperone GrpE